MLKREDKDWIIEFLKERLQKIARYQIPSGSYADISDERTQYENADCPECGEEFEFPVAVKSEINEKFVDEQCVEDLKELAQKALFEVVF